ncbi:MAG: GCN5-related N-acetyltransferase [Herbinix sp.]|jgi:GNAT superfamily N-acetyltransferase|nr:GCN5-related N-acetyltransferase [Herbinix sp.]
MSKIMNPAEFNLRLATTTDTQLVLSFIKELAEYEHMSDQVVATPELLEDTIFVQKKAEVIIGEYEGAAVGFALFFHNYSTFLGRPGIYLEDLYVKEEMRGMGFGTRILSYLAELATERGCGRLEWACLNWNEPSIRFYQQMGGIPMDQWTVYRLQGEALHNMANRRID